jgi:hypothetical protein
MAPVSHRGVWQQDIPRKSLADKDLAVSSGHGEVPLRGLGCYEKELPGVT